VINIKLKDLESRYSHISVQVVDFIEGSLESTVASQELIVETRKTTEDPASIHCCRASSVERFALSASTDERLSVNRSA
jgi:hypothetical protein